MRKFIPTVDTIPFSNEKLKDILEKLYETHAEEISKLEDDIEICREHIFHNTSDEREVGGFTIAICFKKIKEELSCSIEEIGLIDNEDEWFAEYKRIKSLNDQ
ncbi:MAG: hypothetical protein E6R13_03540 [Spirochaetes bacterium]|nr:MAG: hypothetical protein E6R13_03540 [Spirochaetota bacterium]